MEIIFNILPPHCLWLGRYSALYVAVHHYIWPDSHIDVQYALYRSIIERQWKESCFEILDGDVHWSVFGNCGKVLNVEQIRCLIRTF
jgi:hypothetical protein